LKPHQQNLIQQKTTRGRKTSTLDFSANRRMQSKKLRKPRGNFSHGGIKTSSRDEMNLAEFPLAVLSTRVNPKVKTLEFTDSLKLSTGELIERKWIITGADKFGLPTSTDDDVVLGLIRTSMNQGFRDRKVYFSRYELLKTLRWSTEGRSYTRLVKSLDRLSGVRVRSTNSFFDNSTKAYQTCNFGILDAYEINDERNSPSRDKKKSFFMWSEVLFDSFQAGFVKKIDLEFYFSLKSAVSRRLYRYLDKHFYYRSSFETNLLTLAFEKIGVSRSYKYLSSVKQQIEPALEELVSMGFLSKFEFTGSGSETKLRMYASGANVQSQVVAPNESQNYRQQHYDTSSQNQKEVPALATPDTTLVRELVNRGMHIRQAQKLLQFKQPGELDKIKSILKYYDFLLSTGDKKISRNPVGFLYRAVETPHRFSVPQEFKSNIEAAPQLQKRQQRPELKLFTPIESEKNNQSQKNLRAKYEAYKKNILQEAMSSQAPDLQDTKKRISKKVEFLKQVLSETKYQEAFEGCVLEELKNRGLILDFDSYCSGNPTY